MDSSSENWGGKRKGAGRPRSSFVRLSGVQVSREVWEQIEQQAHRQGITPEELTVEVLESFATAPLFAKI